MRCKKFIVAALFAGICASSCMLFTRKHTFIEPTSVALVDESRVDNTKARHIFAEFLLRELVHQGTGWLTIYDLGTYDKGCVPMQIDYLVAFNVMESGIDDIEKGTNKMLVSTKLIECRSTVIVNSVIADTCGAHFNELCEGLAHTLSTPHVKKLKVLRTRIIEEPAILSEPADSSCFRLDD